MKKQNGKTTVNEAVHQVIKNRIKRGATKAQEKKISKIIKKEETSGKKFKQTEKKHGKKVAEKQAEAIAYNKVLGGKKEYEVKYVMKGHENKSKKKQTTFKTYIPAKNREDAIRIIKSEDIEQFGKLIYAKPTGKTINIVDETPANSLHAHEKQKSKGKRPLKYGDYKLDKLFTMKVSEHEMNWLREQAKGYRGGIAEFIRAKIGLLAK